MCGSTARLTMKTPSTLTRSIACNASSGVSSAGPIQATPALLTSTSILMNRVRAASTARLTSAGDVTSAARARPSISAAAASAAARSRSRTATAIPSRASRRAISRPMPPPAPVTSPIRPCSAYMARLMHPQPGRGHAGAFGERFELGPDDVLGHAAHPRRRVEPAIGAGNHAARIAHRRRDTFEPIGDGLGVLDKIGQAVDNPGDDDLVVGKRQFLEHAVLVGVLRVGEREEKAADIGLF